MRNNWRIIDAKSAQKKAPTGRLRQFTPPPKEEGVDEMTQTTRPIGGIDAVIDAELAQMAQVRIAA